MHYIRTLCSFYVAVVTLSVSWTGCKPIAHDPTSHPPKTSKGGSAETLRTDPAARKNGKDNSSFPSHASNAEEHQGVISSDRSPVVTETDEIPLDEIPCSPFTPKNTPDAVARIGVISPDWSPVVTETDEIPLDEIPCRPCTPKNTPDAVAWTGVISPDWSPVVTETDEIPLDEIPCSPFTPKNTPDAVAWTGVISPDWSPVVTETDEIPLDEIPCSPFTPKNTPDAVARTGVISPDELRSITRNLQRSMEKMSEPDPDESFDRNALNRPNSTEEWIIAVRPLDMLGKEMQREIDQVIQVIESQSYNLQQHHEKK
jgi:hypothetical protein